MPRNAQAAIHGRLPPALGRRYGGDVGGTGTCRGVAAAGHPAGTMVLVTFAETKVTRALRGRFNDSVPVSSAEPESTSLDTTDRSVLSEASANSALSGRGAREQSDLIRTGKIPGSAPKRLSVSARPEHGITDSERRPQAPTKDCPQTRTVFPVTP